MSVDALRAIAFYLPQYHPIPENDAWWGKGFTEWRNVAKTQPLFKTHYQPHLPADLGFYDLRVAETRFAQATLARNYGLHGFCYYHYWFSGRRVLELPVNQIMTSGEPDFPFCLCWANENWTRRWDGAESEVLLEQKYSEEDDLAHIQWLAKAFRDPRYIRVEDRPLFLLYRASRLPDPARTLHIWREECRRLGIGELFLCTVESAPSEHGLQACGFDAAVEFAPDWKVLPTPLQRNRKWRWARQLGLGETAYARHDIFSYSDLAARMLAKEEPAYPRFPCVTPAWDNAARRQEGAIIFKDSTPEEYGRWLTEIVQRTLTRPPAERLLFINAWNEWAEGNHLEPCQKWGHGYLEATRAALQGTSG